MIFIIISISIVYQFKIDSMKDKTEEKVKPAVEAGNNQSVKQKVQHSSGTMPSFVYYSLGSIKPFDGFIKNVKKLAQQIIDNFQIGEGARVEGRVSSFSQFCEEQLSSNLHISVSRVFRIYLKEKQVLLNSLKKQIASSCGGNAVIPISFSKITILERKFIVLQVENGVFKQKLQNITEAVDRALQQWKIEPYYSQPIFHATLYKINQQKLLQQIKSIKEKEKECQKKNDQKQKPENRSQKSQQQIMHRMIDDINSELQSIILKKICFNCKDLCLKTGVKVNKLI